MALPEGAPELEGAPDGLRAAQADARDELDGSRQGMRPPPATESRPLSLPGAATSSAGRDSAEEITAFHEQLGLWRLARDALRGHHGNGSPPVIPPDARTVALARLAGLLDARPAAPALRAPAAHRLAALAAGAAQEQDLPR